MSCTIPHQRHITERSMLRLCWCVHFCGEVRVLRSVSDRGVGHRLLFHPVGILEASGVLDLPFGAGARWGEDKLKIPAAVWAKDRCCFLTSVHACDSSLESFPSAPPPPLLPVHPHTEHRAPRPRALPLVNKDEHSAGLLTHDLPAEKR